MTEVAPFSHLSSEVRLVALTRALRNLGLEDLLVDGRRRDAFAAAGLVPGPDEERQALARTVLYRTRIAPAAPLEAAA